MDASRMLARGLAVSRVIFGAGFLVRPALADPTWIGRGARTPGAEVVLRAQAARDLALGLGGLRAMARSDGEETAWLVAYAFADSVDMVTTFAARDRLPRRQSGLATAVAGGSAALALVAAATRRRPRA